MKLPFSQGGLDSAKTDRLTKSVHLSSAHLLHFGAAYAAEGLDEAIFPACLWALPHFRPCMRGSWTSTISRPTKWPHESFAPDAAWLDVQAGFGQAAGMLPPASSAGMAQVLTNHHCVLDCIRDLSAPGRINMTRRYLPRPRRTNGCNARPRSRDRRCNQRCDAATDQRRPRGCRAKHSRRRATPR